MGKIWSKFIWKMIRVNIKWILSISIKWNLHRFFLWLFAFHPRFKKQDVRRKTDLLRLEFSYFSNNFSVESKKNKFPNFFPSTNSLFFSSHRSLILFKFPSNFNVCQDHRSLVDGLMMLILLFEEMRSSLCLPDIESWTLFWSINFCRVIGERFKLNLKGG